MRRTLSRPIFIGIATVLTSLLTSSYAHANTYPMRSCNVPGAATAPVGPWKWEYAYHTVALDDCSAGGGFGLMFPNELVMTRVSTAALRLDRDTTGPKSAIAIRRVRLWLSARLSGSGSFLYVVTTASSASSLTQTDLFAPPGGNTLDEPATSPLLPADTRAFRVVLACSGSSGEGCYPTNRRPLEIRGAEVTLEEDVAPTISIKGGTAVAGGAQSGVRSLTYVAHDDESGIAKVEGLLGDAVVGVHDYRATCTYAEYAACPASASEDLAIDTRAVPDGLYPLRLRTTDAAGNTSTAQSADTVRVANGSAARLTARFDVTSRSAMITHYGRRVAVRGRLTDSAGRPIASARVNVQERVSVAGAKMREKDEVSTNADGRWRYVFRARGPSRDLRFQYGAFSTRLRLKVRASAAIRVSMRGTLVRYAGRVLSRPLPGAGIRVSVQGRTRGTGWQTFATPRAGRSGRFAGLYRLRVHRPGVKLQFRVAVHHAGRYPFATGSSATVSRTVR